jgi:hypothetical protein
MLTIPSISTEYVRSVVTATADPTTATVSFAFLALAVEPTNEWVVAGWEGTATDIGRSQGYDQFSAVSRALIGPGTSWALTDGKYGIWIKIDSAPELSIRRVGVLTIT